MAKCTITCGIASAWLGYGNQKGYSTYSEIKNPPTSGSKVKITDLSLKIPSATTKSGIKGIYLHFNIKNAYSAYVTNIPIQSNSDYSTGLVIRDDHRAALGDFLSNFTENKSIAIEVSSDTVSQALLPGRSEFQLIFNYEYIWFVDRLHYIEFLLHVSCLKGWAGESDCIKEFIKEFSCMFSDGLVEEEKDLSADLFNLGPKILTENEDLNVYNMLKAEIVRLNKELEDLENENIKVSE